MGSFVPLAIFLGMFESTHSWRLLAIVPAYVLVPWIPALRGRLMHNDILPLVCGLLSLAIVLSHRHRKAFSGRFLGVRLRCSARYGCQPRLNPEIFSLGAGPARRADGSFAQLGIAVCMAGELADKRLVLYCFAGVTLFEAGIRFFVLR